MAIYRVSENSMDKVPETTFSEEKLLERRDLQRRLKTDISALSPDMMVVAEEYGDWEDSSRRIDLLCLDKQACLVVVELKRTEDGGHNTYVCLLNSSNSEFDYDDNSGGGTNSRLIYSNLPTGSYFIEV